MQGELERKGSLNPDEEYPIGKLTLSSTRPDAVELVIGYHLLEGKMVDLKKPFAVLEKHSVCLDAADPMDADGEASDQHNATEYKVIGVVRKKCLFKNRPRAIISKPETATRKQRGVAT
ncbi:hypothetical protein COCSUDRAFT_63214 [Coccomyxa subellipsoidea C-169]|uniref:Chromosome transmission fidelity protein 8 n=1 Tax=Coccomyxa subellipsoidea (strain C-169) TaxID=574566 RepID=I0YZ70_COCSC|nr:hypothetical protein COCSUDRAFT_63214 [Coccomyxa subellipsoidea C-169]EIE23689.1 hypothetical protein COCSUDRAFT_63214 [Coccomyxa subellipsoidea C-169]|eukprot:XP_005648233.1 hypothetical protein COCSUDRAFT_63214 [Coccomyxa subellipsoidea C-169]